MPVVPMICDELVLGGERRSKTVAAGTVKSTMPSAASEQRLDVAVR